MADSSACLIDCSSPPSPSTKRVNGKVLLPSTGSVRCPPPMMRSYGHHIWVTTTVTLHDGSTIAAHYDSGRNGRFYFACGDSWYTASVGKFRKPGDAPYHFDLRAPSSTWTEDGSAGACFGARRVAVPNLRSTSGSAKWRRAIVTLHDGSEVKAHVEPSGRRVFFQINYDWYTAPCETYRRSEDDAEPLCFDMRPRS